ncbi:MAG: hypothetical protein Tsb0021_05440 [Chlamydiales bacterium]
MAQPSLKQTFKNILDRREFDRLEPYCHGKNLRQMSQEDRDILAKVLICQARSLLSQNPQDKRGMQALTMAVKASPKNSEILYDKAKLLYEKKKGKRYLKIAAKSVEASLEQNPTSFLAWSLWGWITYSLYLETEDDTLLNETFEKLHSAERLWNIKDDSDGEFYWRFGVIYLLNAGRSGEAVDYKSAISFLLKVQGICSKQKAQYWNDLGNAYVGLGSLIRCFDTMNRSIEAYMQAVNNDPQFFEPWLNMGCTLKHLFDAHPTDDLFIAACAAFERAASIQSDDPILHFKWGLMLKAMGHRTRDLHLYEESVKKLEKANQLLPMNSRILSSLADSMMLLGTTKEDINLIKKALFFSEKSLNLDPHYSAHWYIHGMCYLEIGKYFRDEKQVQLAEHALKGGIALDETSPLLWYGLGLVYSLLGEMCNDYTIVEESLQFFCRAQEFGGEAIYLFWSDWGLTYMKLAEAKRDIDYAKKAIEKFEKALETFNKDDTLVSVDPETLYSYGCAWDLIAEEERDPKYAEKAIESLHQVLILDPEYHHSHFNLGMAYAHLGEMTDDIEYLKQAVICYENFIKYEPEEESAWIEWGMVLLTMAHMLEDPSHPELSQILMDDAENKFLTAASLGSVQSFYLMTCLNTLRGNYNAALLNLEKAILNGAHIDIQVLLHDPSFEGLRKAPGFHELINKII